MFPFYKWENRGCVNKERSWPSTPRQCFVSSVIAASARKSLSIIQQPSMAPSGLSDNIGTLHIGNEAIWLSSPYLRFQPQISLPTSIYCTFQFHPSLFLEMVCLVLMPSLTCFHLPGKHIFILKPHSVWVTWWEGSSLPHVFLHIVTLSSVPCTEPMLSIFSFTSTMHLLSIYYVSQTLRYWKDKFWRPWVYRSKNERLEQWIVKTWVSLNVDPHCILVIIFF